MTPKNSLPATPASPDTLPRLPATVDREHFEGDIVLLYFYWARVSALLAGPGVGAAWMKRPMPDPTALFDPDLLPSDLGLKFEDISDLDLAKYSGWMYDYGVHAIEHAAADRMGDETPYTWLSAQVFDLFNSTLLEQFTGDGGDAIRSAAERWLRVAELANARNILEGGESFFHFSRLRGAEDASSEDHLTIRHMALLAGMEEMSVRTAANPKRPNPLQTITEGGRTYVQVEVAKEWLKRKGRYMPVRRSTGQSLVDLTTARIDGTTDLIELLKRRLAEIRKHDADMQIWKRLEAAGILKGDAIDSERLRMVDEGFLGLLADHLGVDADILRLRVQEALAKDTVNRVSREISRLAARS